MPTQWILGGLVILGSLPLTGCATSTGNGALFGTGLGATTGAVLGSVSGNAGKGALIGATAGALGGALVGNAEDAARQRDAAWAHAYQVEQQQFAAQAVTNADVVTMTQSGVSQEVIINAIRTRGGQFDTSPNALIWLKNSGVSDAVIATMQQSGSPIAPVSTTTVVPPPAIGPEVIVVEPRPAPIFVHPGPIRFRSPRRCRPYRRHGHSAHLHIDL
ncbi:glycine zipper domain-containing protein [Thalassoroseus pseudoceratinae]|uniref:glycine zipper domain-containing protein n=1 Tax=Thalassoroseus pseudoceratinae TaxID=2713176 RepID=UPI001421503B|nr:glycine zipper domain-containing protein [Thalassoroseus pseudoceratinae]